jgi:opacity protein-like surface antigen
MKRLTAAMMIGAVAVLVAASPAHAQYVFFGGGASIPMGDFKDFAKTGWMATAGLGADIGDKGLFIEAEGFYGKNKHKAPDDGDATNIISGLGAVGYSFMPEKSVRPYVLGGVGFLMHQFDPAVGDNETETKFAYSGAVGLSIKAGSKLNLWLEARFLGSSETKILPLMAGVTINFGK